MAECRLPAPVKANLVEGSRNATQPGQFSYTTRYGDETKTPAGLLFLCPGCGKKGYVGFNPPSPDDIKYGRHTWNWDGNREAPTLTPSIHNHDWVDDTKPLAEQPTHWHGWLQKGMFVQA